MLKLTVFIFLVIQLVKITYSSRSFPKFVEIPDTIVVEDSITSSAVRPQKWYAAWPTNLRLVYLGTKYISYNLYCTTEALSKGNELDQITFCFNPKSGSENCQTLTSSMGTSEINIVRDKGPVVKLFFNPSTGGFAKMLYIEANQDVSSIFYCSVKNKRGTVVSNKVEFIDLRRQFPPSIISKSEPTQPLHKNGPSIFPCVNINVPDEVTLAYAWNVCPTKLFRLCDASQPVRSTPSWPAQILKNGSLYFPYLTDEMESVLLNRYLYCSVEKIPAVYYSRPVLINNSPAPNPVTSLTITHPFPTDVEVKLLNSDNTVVTHYCNFEVGMGNFKVVWKKYTGSTVTILQPGENPRFSVNLVANHGIRFVGPFKAETEGKYICEVEWTPIGGAPVKKSAGYDVSLQYFPEVSKNIVPEVYVVSGTNGSFTCSFRKPFPEPKPTGNTVKPSLAINGAHLDLKSESDLTKSMTSINTEFSETMGTLTVAVNPINPKPGDSVTYTAMKMMESHFINKKSMSHMVDCIGTNTVGTVRKTVLLKVIPSVVLASTPKDTNCTSCSAKEDHVFKCKISNLEVYNKTSSQVIVNQYWKVGNSIMGRSQSSIIISSDNTTLTVKKITDQKVKDSLNKNGRITCIITMQYPPTMQQPDNLEVGPYMTKIFYNSETDPAVMQSLTTEIQLKDIAPQPKAASLSWVIAVALSILVILIVVILVFVWCRRRPPGETYDVDHTEKKQGNDPETENHEKEAFPVYERPEDGPIRGSRASLDDSIQVGSDDEDEDLAEYDVDIGKFNEEGSFIGQYAVNDGHGGGQPNNSRKLPNFSTNSAV